jgi:hypothetical protein
MGQAQHSAAAGTGAQSGSTRRSAQVTARGWATGYTARLAGVALALGRCWATPRGKRFSVALPWGVSPREERRKEKEEKGKGVGWGMKKN